MGVDVVVGGATDAELNEIARLFEGWDSVFSRFRRGSELNRVNGDSAPVLVVSKLFASVVRDALGAASATRGLVDPTLGLAIVKQVAETHGGTVAAERADGGGTLMRLRVNGRGVS